MRAGRAYAAKEGGAGLVYAAREGRGWCMQLGKGRGGAAREGWGWGWCIQLGKGGAGLVYAAMKGGGGAGVCS